MALCEGPYMLFDGARNGMDGFVVGHCEKFEEN